MGCEMSRAMFVVGCGVGGQGQRDVSWRGWCLPIALASRGWGTRAPLLAWPVPLPSSLPKRRERCGGWDIAVPPVLACPVVQLFQLFAPCLLPLLAHRSVAQDKEKSWPV